jgi:hypothetical protein
MAIASLLVTPKDASSRAVFSFEHAMAHRTAQQQMGPLNRWSLMPYFIDPTNFQANPADKWNLNHQQAHWDMREVSPQSFVSTDPGIPTAQPLMDTNQQSPGAVAWTTFANHQEHFILNNAIMPFLLHGIGTVATPWAPPWWFTAPRYVPQAW